MMEQEQEQEQIAFIPIDQSHQGYLFEMLYQAIYVDSEDNRPNRSIVHQPELRIYAENWGQRGDFGFLAVEQPSRKRLGAVWIRFFNDSRKGYGYISDDIPEMVLAVEEEVRGQGIGTRLLSELLQSLPENMGAVSLSVDRQNPATRLYRSFGFHEHSRKGSSITMVLSRDEFATAYSVVIVGGDKRNYWLAKLLNQYGINTYLMGFEQIDDTQTFSTSILQKAETVIGPIPFTVDGKDVFMPYSDKTLSVQSFLHNLDQNIPLVTTKNGAGDSLDHYQVHDVTSHEDFALRNAVPTAEGILELLIRNTDRTIHGSKILILGFGRIGQYVSKLLSLMGAKLCVFTYDAKEKGLAYQNQFSLHDNPEILPSLKDFHAIINTIPAVLYSDESFEELSAYSVFIDVASYPGGTPAGIVNHPPANVVIAKGLPGKTAPYAAAENMFQFLIDQSLL